MIHFTNAINEMIDYPITNKMEMFNGYTIEYCDRTDILSVINEDGKEVIKMVDYEAIFIGDDDGETLPTKQEEMMMERLNELYMRKQEMEEWFQEPDIF